MGCAKCYLIGFNTIFLLFGGGCLAGGIYILMDKSEILVLTRSATSSLNVDDVVTPSLIETAAYVFIGLGGFVFITSLMGFCGACCENNKCLIIYIVIVGTILLAQGTAVVLSVIYKDQFETYARDNLKALQQTRYKGPYDTSDIVSLAFDIAHIYFQCCGVDNGTEYASISNWNTTYAYDAGGGSYVVGVATIPATCCEFSNMALFPSDITGFLNSMTNNTCPITQSSSYSSKGCYEAIKDRFSQYFNIVIGVGAGIAGMELLGVIAACCLIKKEKDEKDQNDEKDD
ncbi:tetraspanin-18-like [Ylistrum balloti]|uniref:tetraspanin-18-like n=1 Tax=Ylistrum balloti TaxID=509963 RepID=UPI002905BEF6|nr:tetraspanin-18-like [Ylistrum balloti]